MRIRKVWEKMETLQKPPIMQHIRKSDITATSNSKTSDYSSTSSSSSYSSRKAAWAAQRSRHNQDINSQADKKPPVRPVVASKRTSVINLDKNCLSHTHRSLLPRPLSLPNSFNLIWNFRSTENLSTPFDDVTVDIAVIKQLEDEIYNRKEDILRQNSVCTQQHDAANCAKCTTRLERSATNPAITITIAQDDTEPEPSTIINRGSCKSLQLDGSTFPLLFQTPPDSPHSYVAKPLVFLASPKSQQPIKRSASDSRTNVENPNVPLASTTASTLYPSRNALPNKNFAQQFLERCLGKTTTAAIDQSHDADVVVRKRKSTKFQRFIAQRRSLNLSSKRASVAVHAQPLAEKSDVSEISDRLTAPINCHGHANKSILKTNKFKVLLMKGLRSSRLRQYHNDAQLLQHQNSCDTWRRWKSLETIDAYSDRDDFVYGARSWSHSDLIELKKSNLLGDTNNHSSGYLSGDLSSRDRLRSSRRPKGRPASYNKRHSVGSSTDVVKTWVYRRR